MARLRDGGSGDPALWMRARQETTEHEKQTLLVRLWEAEEVIAELEEKLFRTICGDPIICHNCDDGTVECAECGVDVYGSILCSSCFEDHS